MTCFVAWPKNPGGSLCWCLEWRNLVGTLTVVRTVGNWEDWDGERDPGSPSQGAFITGKGLHTFVIQELEIGRTNVLQASHSEKTSGLPRGTDLCALQIFSFFFQLNRSIGKNTTAWGEKLRGSQWSAKQIPKYTVGRQKTSSYTLPSLCLISPTGATTIILGHHLSFPVPHQADESQLDPISRGLIW